LLGFQLQHLWRIAKHAGPEIVGRRSPSNLNP
jgi:hypothetical protein